MMFDQNNGESHTLELNLVPLYFNFNTFRVGFSRLYETRTHPQQPLLILEKTTYKPQEAF